MTIQVTRSVDLVTPELASREAQLRGLLRRVREELVRIRSRLETHTAGPPAAAGTSWLAIDTVFRGERAGITHDLRRTEDLVDRHPELLDGHSDALVRIRNIWGDLEAAWSQARRSVAATPDIGPSTADIRPRIDELILEIAYITIPARVNQNLRGLRVGGVLNFARDFGDELPAKGMQETLLKWMQAHPCRIEGVIDVPNGRIFRGSPELRRRMRSYLLLLGVVVLAVVAGATATHWLTALDLPRPPGLTDKKLAWAIVTAYLGAVAHVLVAAAKQRNRIRTDPEGFFALGNVAVWVHVNEGYLLMYALAIPAACCSLLWTSDKLGGVAMTAFAVGYSIDSFLEVFLARFDKLESATSQALRQAAKA